MSTIYQDLREHLDTMSSGFPETKNNSDITLLKRLFTEEEAALFMAISPIPETPEVAAERLGRDCKQLSGMMEDMAKKGLLFRVRNNDIASYCSIPYVVGIMEFQIKNLETSKELAKDIAAHSLGGFMKSLQSLDTHHQRTIPINTGIVSSWPITPYEDAVEMIKEQKRIAVANCVCRAVTRSVAPELCDKPLETCMMFGASADYYVENGMGREISIDEAVALMKTFDEHALVAQPINSKKAGAICACCGDCCGMLNSLKMQSKPAESVKSNYIAEMNQAECTGCEICLDRCQMGAITMAEDSAMLNLDRCIGCGLCVTTCPTEALTLMKKPDDMIYEPPETHSDMYISMGKERGVIG